MKILSAVPFCDEPFTATVGLRVTYPHAVVSSDRAVGVQAEGMGCLVTEQRRPLAAAVLAERVEPRMRHRRMR
jgi:hypothetical protein